MKFTLKKSQVKGMLLLAGKEDIRYYLNGLHVMQDGRGTILEATTSPMAGRLRIDQTPVLLAENEKRKSVIIKRADAEKLIQEKAKSDYMIDVEVDDKKIVAKVSGVTYEFTAEDASYPDLDRIVPKPYQAKVAWFDPELVSTMGKAIETIYGIKKKDSKELAAKWCLVPNGDGASLAVVSDSEDFYGLLMPMKKGTLDNVSAPW
jgi:DNA polymerase-3 subunit beta